MPLEKGLAMVRSAFTELYVSGGMVDQSILRQHITAAYEARRKWQIEQSWLKNEAAQRFRTRANGWKALLGALGVGSVITLLVEHVLLKLSG